MRNVPQLDDGNRRRSVKGSRPGQVAISIREIERMCIISDDILPSMLDCAVRSPFAQRVASLRPDDEDGVDLNRRDVHHPSSVRRLAQIWRFGLNVVCEFEDGMIFLFPKNFRTNLQSATFSVYSIEMM